MSRDWNSALPAPGGHQVSGKYSPHRSCLLELTSMAEVKKSRWKTTLGKDMSPIVSLKCVHRGVYLSSMPVNQPVSCLLPQTLCGSDKGLEKEEGITEKQQMWLDFWIPYHAEGAKHHMRLCHPKLVTSPAGYSAGVNWWHPTGFNGTSLIYASWGSGPEIAVI